MQPTPLAIIAALDDEIRVIRSKMEIDTRVHVRPALFETGKYSSRPLLLARSGIGMDAMQKAISYCLARYSPKFCLHMGYCGGADPKFQAGDLIVASSVVNGQDGRRCDANTELTQKALNICGEKKLRAETGVLVTVDKMIIEPHEKAFAGTKHGAVGIDMESFALAAECASRGVLYLIVRAVLDPLDAEFPDMEGAVDRTGKADIPAIAEHMIRNPGDIFKLPRMQYFANEARGAITAFAEAWIQNKEVAL